MLFGAAKGHQKFQMEAIFIYAQEDYHVCRGLRTTGGLGVYVPSWMWRSFIAHFTAERTEECDRGRALK
jgi:hypothetical protein